MTNFTSQFLHSLAERNFIHQMSDAEGLDKYAATAIPIGYIGFDCTAPSLHVGNLISILLLRKLQRAGGRPIIVLGGATSKIGDPSGKDSTRKFLSTEDIARNKARISGTFKQFLRFDASNTSAVIYDNSDWLDDINYIDFLRDYGQHFSVNRMLRFDSVRLRLEREQNLSFLEFNYMILQAYDFLALYQAHGCRLQMGGADQWGNIVNGIELARRVAGCELFGLTTPLLTNSAGAKMGKTAQGAVWLAGDMFSPYDYWQFWRNCEDADILRLLRLFTELPCDMIDDLCAVEGERLNEAKKVLATEATAMAHGRNAAEAAAQTAFETFDMGGASTTLPHTNISHSQWGDGISIIEALRLSGLATTNSEARRLVTGGGVRVNDIAIFDIHTQLSTDDIRVSQIKLSVGKKRHVLLKLQS